MPENIANTPGSVTVAFPKALYGTVNNCIRMNSGIRVEEWYALTIVGIGRIANTENIHSSAIANFTGGSSPVNETELHALATKIAADFYTWRLACLEVRYEGAVEWNMDGGHDLEWLHGPTRVTTSVHRSEWLPDFAELQHAGSWGSSSEPPICGTQGVEATTGFRFQDGTFDGTLLLRDNGAHSDAADTSIWLYDWGGAKGLVPGSRYNGTFRGKESRGPFVVSIIDDNTGNPLTDTAAWLPLLSDPLAPLAYVPAIVATVAINNGALTLVTASAPTDFAGTLDVIITDANASITGGKVTIQGTNQYGDDYVEDVNLPSHGGTQTYTTTGQFATITAALVSGLSGPHTGDTVAIVITEYPHGILRTTGGHIYAVTNPAGTASAPPGSDWTQVDPMTPIYTGYAAGDTYSLGDVVQEIRPVYAIHTTIQGTPGPPGTTGPILCYTSGTFVVPADGSAVTVPILGAPDPDTNIWMVEGQTIIITDGTHVVYGWITAIADATHFTFQTTRVAAGSPGDTMVTGATVIVSGDPIGVAAGSVIWLHAAVIAGVASILSSQNVLSVQRLSSGVVKTTFAFSFPTKDSFSCVVGAEDDVLEEDDSLRTPNSVVHRTVTGLDPTTWDLHVIGSKGGSSECNAWIRIPPGALPDANGWILAYQDDWVEATQEWVQVREVYVRDANS